MPKQYAWAFDGPAIVLRWSSQFHCSLQALWGLWGSFRVALGWLWSAYQLAINTLCGGFKVALGGFRGGYVSKPSKSRWRVNIARLPSAARGHCSFGRSQ